MSLHMSLQLLPRKKGSSSTDGLYRWRYAVYALYIVVPGFDAALAFVSHSGHYLSQGAFCSLPIRPFWYRLALSWIPRYLTWIYVMSVAFRIYRQVGTGFQVFARKHDYSSTKDGQSTTGVSVVSAVSAVSGVASQPSQARQSRGESLTTTTSLPPWTDGFHIGTSLLTPPADAHLMTPSGRKLSYVRFETTSESPIKEEPSPPGSDKASAGYFDVPADSVVARSPNVDATKMEAPEATAAKRSSLPPIDEIKARGAKKHKQSKSLAQVANAPTDKRRRNILRQVRLLFIYPCVYMIFMVMPFVAHCMSYSDYWAAHPVYIISALNPFCFTFLGFVDCVVFCWRERPWSNIPGSDGTFWGSFFFWRFGDLYEPSGMEMTRTNTATKNNGESGSQKAKVPSHRLRPTLKSAVHKPSHTRVFSGNSDRVALEAERAQQRLALERAAYAEEHRKSALPVGARSPPAREWFDRSMSDDLDGTDDEDDDTGSVIDHRDKNKKDASEV